MALTRRQRELFKEAEAVAALTKLNYHMIEEADPEARILLLRIAINKVIAETVTRLTLLDEIRSDIIARYFFKVPRSARFGQPPPKLSTETLAILGRGIPEIAE